MSHFPIHWRPAVLGYLLEPVLAVNFQVEEEEVQEAEVNVIWPHNKHPSPLSHPCLAAKIFRLNNSN